MEESTSGSSDKTIAFIPVRGGSISIPMKNIKQLCGKPLLYWVAEAANRCAFIDEVVVSTDSSEIARVAQSMGLEKVRVVGRGAETATNTASTESAVIEYAESHDDFDTMVLIQATSPLLTSSDLDEGFAVLAQPGVDSVLSVVEDFRFYWRPAPCGDGEMIVEPINYDVYRRPRRQDFDGCYMENGAFYISRREDILRTGNRISGKIAVSVMSADTAFEIDEPEDWEIIEALMKKRQVRQRDVGLDFGCVKMLLTDCDGCLTDAGMYYSESGEELKKFSTRDGMAFKMLRDAGVLVGVITGENSQAVLRRAQKLNADYVEIGCRDKISIVRRICNDASVSLDEVAYIGDDVNDVEVLMSVGVPCCPCDAQLPAKEVARYVSRAAGGQGVIREISSLILAAKR